MNTRNLLSKAHYLCALNKKDMQNSLSEQESVRREALEGLISKGINPYPAEEFDVNASALEIKENFKEGDLIHA